MREALGFLTVFGGARQPTARALPWFGLVGALIGLVVGVVGDLTQQVAPTMVAAALALVADLVLTGMLHVDGLADAADGLLPPVDRERRLVIMRDPHVGAFGMVAVVAVLITRFAGFAALPLVDVNPLAVAAVWCTARVAMAVTITTVPYARGVGLATAFAGADAGTVLLTGAPLALVLAVAGTVGAAAPVGPLAVGAAAAAAAGVVLLARARIGGYTGDVLGAAGVLAETVGLLVLAVQP